MVNARWWIFDNTEFGQSFIKDENQKIKTTKISYYATFERSHPWLADQLVLVHLPDIQRVFFNKVSVDMKLDRPSWIYVVIYYWITSIYCSIGRSSIEFGMQQFLYHLKHYKISKVSIKFLVWINFLLFTIICLSDHFWILKDLGWMHG